MQEKYTEDIDKLDSFYQEAMEHASIEPPAAMWDKIGASYAEQKKLASVFKKRYLLALLLLLFISSTGIFIYLRNNTEKTQKNIQEEKNNIENTSPEIKDNSGTENSPSGVLEKKSNAGIQNTDQKNNTEDNKTETSSDPVNVTNPVIEETKPTVVEPTPASKPDSVSIPKESTKKKMNFREKHTQNVKADSLRPLFVPVK